MRVEILERLIEALDPTTFREFARECIKYRGYSCPSLSDGWADGGRDVRVYLVDGLTPARLAFQTSIERNWDGKLLADAKKARDKLKCSSFVYVTNRRIADAEFEPIKQRALADLRVSVSKIDKQDLASQVIDQDRLGWFLDLAGLKTEQESASVSLRQEVADAFALFSDDVREFRQKMVEHAVLVCAYRTSPISRSQLIQDAAEAVDLTDMSRIESATDRLLQSSALKPSNGKIILSEPARRRYDEAKKLVSAEWTAFVDGVRQLLNAYLPKRPKKSAANTADVALQVAGKIGQVIHAYRDFQVSVVEKASNQVDIRRKYMQEMSSVESFLHQLGVPTDHLPECIRALTVLETSHPVVTKLTAGEVFRRLTSRGGSALLTALGRVNDVRMFLESSVMIPLLCTRLYRTVTGNLYLEAAARLYELAANLKVQFVLPDVYLEECATHVLIAGRYKAIVEAGDRTELQYSENAFVSYFAVLPDAPAFDDYLKSFGYQQGNTDFTTERDRIKATLARLLRRYDVEIEQVSRFRGDGKIRRVVEQSLEQIYHREHISKPDVLERHDVAMVHFIQELSLTSHDALLLVTWDRALQAICQDGTYEWWCLDPVNTADLFSLVSSEGEGSMGVEIALFMDAPQLKLASKVWDTIVSIERDNMFDGQLHQMASDFRTNFLLRQTADRASTDKISSAWTKWKEETQALGNSESKEPGSSS